MYELFLNNKNTHGRNTLYNFENKTKKTAD